MEKHKHSAVQDAGGVYALYRDGHLLNCPKTVYPNINQGVTGAINMTLMRFPCSTSCPFAQVIERDTVAEGTIAKEGKEIIYAISCEGRCNEIVLDKVTQYEAPKVESPLQLVNR